MRKNAEEFECFLDRIEQVFVAFKSEAVTSLTINYVR